MAASLEPVPRPLELPGRSLPVPRSAAEAFVVCLILLEATAVGFVAFDGRGRVLETILVGVACLVAYRAGWRAGRFAPIAATAAFLALEWHYGRLLHSRYWQEVFLTLMGAGATLAAAYLRRAVDVRDQPPALRAAGLAAQRVYDEIDRQLGLDTRRLNTLTFELERARRHNHSLSVLLVRPDDFDELQLRFGEDAGAIMLQAVAAAIGRSLRASDIPVREPPADFAVILPETARYDARIVAERVRLAVRGRRLEFGPGEVVDPAVSIGVAAFPQDATTNDQMMQAVHCALQGSVEAGGNRTMLYSIPEGAPAGWGLSREQLTS